MLGNFKNSFCEYVLIVCGINYMGELGWELHHPMKQMGSLYDAIYEVGRKDNLSLIHI